MNLKNVIRIDRWELVYLGLPATFGFPFSISSKLFYFSDAFENK